MTARMNPECAAGKHPNCDGKAWRDDLDRIGSCTCDCHKLPETIKPGDTGHAEAHRLFRADYEAERGPMVVERKVSDFRSEFPIAFVDESEVHALLHVHFGLPGDPPGPFDTGHVHHHELLARAYNERHQHE